MYVYAIDSDMHAVGQRIFKFYLLLFFSFLFFSFLFFSFLSFFLSLSLSLSLFSTTHTYFSNTRAEPYMELGHKTKRVRARNQVAKYARVRACVRGCARARVGQMNRALLADLHMDARDHRRHAHKAIYTCMDSHGHIQQRARARVRAQKQYAYTHTHTYIYI